MVKRFIILVTLLIINVGADVSNYEDEIDSGFLDIINDDFDDNPECDENENNNYQDLTFSEGMWRCGDCSSIDESKLLYEEFLEVDTNYYLGQSLNTQIGFALNNMRCITIKTHRLNIIRCVTGSCLGDQVTLSVLSPFSTYIKIYGQ